MSIRTDAEAPASRDWRREGIRVVRAEQRSCDTPDTLGMNREVAISGTRTGSRLLWAGTNRIEGGAKTGAHHHGELESIIYVVRGRAEMRWGERLEFTAQAGPGSFIFVPPFLPHQEINALDDEPLECVVVRSGQDPIVVNLDIEGVADPEVVPWIDSTHPVG